MFFYFTRNLIVQIYLVNFYATNYSNKFDTSSFYCGIYKRLNEWERSFYYKLHNFRYYIYRWSSYLLILIIQEKRWEDGAKGKVCLKTQYKSMVLYWHDSMLPNRYFNVLQHQRQEIKRNQTNKISEPT